MVAVPERDTATVEAVYAALVEAADDGHRPHLGASLIGRECARDIWYVWRWATGGVQDGRVLRLFRHGQDEERRLAEDLRRAGVTVVDRTEDGRQWSFSDLGGHFGGSMDGAVLGLLEAPKAWHVWECKTANTRSFAAIRKNGVEKEKPEHWVQMQCYMHWSGMERAYYTVVNKDSDEIYAERVRYDRSAALAAIDRARGIIESREPPPYINERPEYYLCKSCQHRGVCREGFPPLTHCRTCAFSEARLDGDGRWHCALQHKNLSLDEQRAGCAQYRVISGPEAREQEDVEKLMAVFGARTIESTVDDEGDPDDPLTF